MISLLVDSCPDQDCQSFCGFKCSMKYYLSRKVFLINLVFVKQWNVTFCSAVKVMKCPVSNV